MKGWVLKVDEPDKKVYYKQEPGIKLMSMMCECIVNAPLVNVMARYSENDLFKSWMPNIAECTMLKELSQYRKLVRVE
jgi:hypothetical protein